MVMPLYDDDARQRVSQPYVTWALVTINVVAFFVLCLMPEVKQLEIIHSFGFTAAHIADFSHHARDALLTPLSSMFLHISWEHLFFNMLFLMIFGDNVEDALGHVRYLVFYLLCGYAGSFADFLANIHSVRQEVGASGAVSGVVVAYLMIRPCAKIEVLISFFPVALSAYWVVGFFAATQAWNLIAHTENGVAYWAHLGGMVMGALLLPLLRHPDVVLFECMSEPSRASP